MNFNWGLRFNIKGERLLDPLAIYPYRRSPRIVAQKGVFTIHGMKREAMQDIFKNMDAPPIKSFHLSPEARDDALAFLETVGVNEFSLFPDLDGLAEHVKWRLDRRRGRTFSRGEKAGSGESMESANDVF